MSNWGEHSDRLLFIKQEWDKAEEAIKLAEQVCGEVVTPSVKELRYAGRRLVDAIGKIGAGAPPSEIDGLLHDAYFDCHRARHDAIDAATAKIAKVLDIAATKIGYEVILKAYPSFSLLFGQLNLVRSRIAVSRGDRENRERVYASIEAVDFPALAKEYDNFKAAEPIMKGLAKTERKRRVLNYVIGIAGLLATIFSLLK
ncbi:MAG: hypothetical protein HQL45_01915 [Alphaproteobacteria bacterium]|nr:hypothetical protein [Alphaproteobacteria bacterium]